MRSPLRTAARLLLDSHPMRSLPARLVALFAALLAITSLVGCGSTPDSPDGEGAQPYGGEIAAAPGEAAGDNGDEGDGPIVALDDGAIGQVAQSVVASSKMRTTGNVNLRKGPASSYAVVAVVPADSTVTVLDPKPQNGFYNIDFNGTAGWSSGNFLAAIAPTGAEESATGAVDINGAASPDNAIARAKKAVGFSYYWGGGAWLAAGVSSGTAGSCSGNCPSCSHSGRYGADCSGMIAKAWQFGPKALEVDSHPYSTISFNGSSSNWSTVSRGSFRKGDALVYNTNGRGHIALYEKGDAWGTPTVIECRGCAYGCVYNARSFTSNYKGIRRAGF